MPDLTEGHLIGSYRIVRVLGRGGMSIVYEAEHVRLGTRCALKTFTLAGEDADLFRKRFLAEGRLLARLNHPRIVRVHDMDVTDGLAWFAMDLVLAEDGSPKTLADVPRDGTVPESRLAGWYEDIRGALAAVHAAGIVHRDVKLENMLLGADGHAYLTDFGISKIADERLRQELSVTLTLVSADAGGKALVGTSAYLPPEVREGRPLSRESDYYSLGVSFFRLLTGLWYAPGPHAFDLLSPFGKPWRQALGSLLAADPSARLLLPVGKARSANRTPLAFAAGVLLGLAVAGAAALTLSVGRDEAPSMPPAATARLTPVVEAPRSVPTNGTSEADLADFAIPDWIQ